MDSPIKSANDAGRENHLQLVNDMGRKTHLELVNDVGKENISSRRMTIRCSMIRDE